MDIKRKISAILLAALISACDNQDTAQVDQTTEITLPPLTYTHKFENCPFEVKFPGEPETLFAANSPDQAVYSQPNIKFYAYCYENSELDDYLELPSSAAKIYLELMFKDPLYATGKIYELGKEKEELPKFAQVKYIASLTKTDKSYGLKGLIFVYNNYLIDLAILSKKEDESFDINMTYFSSLKIVDLN